MYKKIVLLILAGSLLNCGKKAERFPDALCITNITAIDPLEGVKNDRTLILKDGKIQKVVSADSILLDKKNVIIDGKGKFLIPGLWDTHVHFAYIENLAPSMFDLFLRHGITSVRDTGGKLDFVSAWKNKASVDPAKAPRVMIAGPLLDGLPNVYDGSSPNRPGLSIGIEGVDDMAERIDSMLEAGVDFLKAYEMLTPEQFKKICALAKEKGLKVTGHIPLSMDAISASNAGMNSIEHLRNIEISCASNAQELWEERKKMLNSGKGKQGGKLRSSIHEAQRAIAIANYDEAKAAEVLAVLKKNDTWQVPTLVLNTLLVNRYFDEAEYRKSYQMLPDTLPQNWEKQSIALQGYPVSEFRKNYAEWNFMMVGEIHEKEIPIMAGTDTPIALLMPGLSLHRELELLVRAGLSEQEALKAATINPAQYFGLENELGQIKEGMWADLLILDADPLEKIGNTRRINTVIKHGKVYEVNRPPSKRN